MGEENTDLKLFIDGTPVHYIDISFDNICNDKKEESSQHRIKEKSFNLDFVITPKWTCDKTGFYEFKTPLAPFDIELKKFKKGETYYIKPSRYVPELISIN